jgi:PAS domain S-box-containing protein
VFKSLKDILRPVYAQSLFVFAAFAAMAVASYVFMSAIERNHLIRNVNDTITNVQTHITSELREPETALGVISETLRVMILSGYDSERVQNYITYINNYIKTDTDDRMIGVIGCYGIFDAFDGAFMAGDASFVSPETYDHTTTPWYIAAVNANGEIGITEPYIDSYSNEYCITFARRIFDEDGLPLGIICLDITLDRIRGFVVNARVTEDSYGILADGQFNIIAHPHPAYSGKAMRLMNDGPAIENELRQGREISERKATDYKGNQSVLFVQQIDNGWYMGILAYTKKYYYSVSNIAFILGLLGMGMAIILNVILIRISAAKHRADENNRRMAHWYVSILDTIPFPLSITDKEMKWTFINAATEKILNVRREDILGQHCSRWRAHICNSENCGVARVRQGFHQTHFRQGDGSYQVDVEMLKDLNGEVDGYIEVVQDITKLEQMAVQQAEAEAASRAKSNFLARVSHEIRTPMNAILGIAEIQMQNKAASRDIHEALEKIYSSGYSLLGIINDILDFSKIEAGKLELVPVKYDVASLIHDTVQLNMMRIGSKMIKFNLEIEPSIPAELHGDELRIKQILNNLLSNAFKYTDSGEITLMVNAKYVEEEKEPHVLLTFIVRDTGQGMTHEQLKKLFDEYSRFNAEANRSTEGTGLGMSITKHLLELMGGTIDVKSEPGKGSTFTVHLPQGIAGFGVLGSEVVEKLRQFRFHSMTQMKTAQIVREPMPYGSVLVVDDVETNLYVAKGLLAPYELAIDTADSGFEAIEKIKANNVYDVIFMDHMMPKMDGIEATRLIRELGYKQPIVALTANAVLGQAAIFLSNGFDEFISKPIDIRQLNAVLNKMVRDKQPPEVIAEAQKNRQEKAAAEALQAAMDPELAGVFVRDAKKAINVLETICKKNDLDDNDMQTYTINSHAIRGALANIGEEKLSEVAKKLEMAGRERDAAVIANETPDFLINLQDFIKKVTPKEKGGDSKTAESDMAYLQEKLVIFRAACVVYDKKAAKDVIIELKGKSWPRPIKELLNTLTEFLLHSEFEEAANIVRDYDFNS